MSTASKKQKMQQPQEAVADESDDTEQQAVLAKLKERWISKTPLCIAHKGDLLWNRRHNPWYVRIQFVATYICLLFTLSVRTCKINSGRRLVLRRLTARVGSTETLQIRSHFQTAYVPSVCTYLVCVFRTVGLRSAQS